MPLPLLTINDSRLPAVPPARPASPHCVTSDLRHYTHTPCVGSRSLSGGAKLWEPDCSGESVRSPTRYVAFVTHTRRCCMYNEARANAVQCVSQCGIHSDPGGGIYSTTYLTSRQGRILGGGGGHWGPGTPKSTERNMPPTEKEKYMDLFPHRCIKL